MLDYVYDTLDQIKQYKTQCQLCWCDQRNFDSENSCTLESNSWIIHHQCLLSTNPVFAKLEERATNTLHTLHTLHCKNFQIRTQQPHHQEHPRLKMNKSLMHRQDVIVILPMPCYRRKSTVLPGKLISSKKTPKNSVFWRTNMGITSLWEDLEAKLLTPGQLLGYP